MIETETRVQSEHDPVHTFSRSRPPSFSFREDGIFIPPNPPPEKSLEQWFPGPARGSSDAQDVQQQQQQQQQQPPPPSRALMQAPKNKEIEDEKETEPEDGRRRDADTCKDSESTAGEMTDPGQPSKNQSTPTQHKRKQSQVDSMSPPREDKEKVLKLSPEKIHQLTYAPESLSQPLPPIAKDSVPISVSAHAKLDRSSISELISQPVEYLRNRPQLMSIDTSTAFFNSGNKPSLAPAASALRPPISARAMSTPATAKRIHSPTRQSGPVPKEKAEEKKPSSPFHLELSRALRSPALDPALPSPMPPSLPLPPLSIPTYLQLELSSHRPSQLYIHRSVTSDFPYESSRVKIERLLNFLLLPPHLEGVLCFGTLACFDAWLYTFTILPLRLFKSFYILLQSWATNLVSESRYISTFVYNGTGRMWRRRRTRGVSESKHAKMDHTGIDGPGVRDRPRHQRNHRRIQSVPSMLLPDDKADILTGALIICTCVLLLRLDASRMYHWIRGQAAMKLYVIYNVLEVCDRLFSAIGQDVLECLFSRETLERKPDGHSKVLRPFWLFVLALIYTTIHSTALFYQVITLNVAVNSYSNALITLLMSNQFVEIKSTVFKKFEKENLFQLTCADVVERFQLWLMLTIIASRNIVETGGLSMGLEALTSIASTSSGVPATNTSTPLPPRSASSILPRSFTLVPALLSSLTAYAPSVGQVLGPFLVVLGSEIFVDWLKHAYISKFNNTRPAIYGRFLDVLAKDYYSNAFAEQNLTKRLGLPVIPLSCLFIRASVQTYHMFMAAWVPSAVPSSSTSLASIHQQYAASRASAPTSTVTALSHKFDDLIRHIPSVISSSRVFNNFTTIVIFMLMFLVLLACKLVLGMVLLSFSRARYRSMKEREKDPIHDMQGGKRVGGWGVVEVDEDKRRWIYEDDPAGLRALREREERNKAKRERGTGEGFDKVKRYEMVAKRIW